MLEVALDKSMPVILMVTFPHASYYRARYYDPIYRQIPEAHGPDAMTWKASRATYVGGVNTARAGPGSRAGLGGF